MKKGTKVILGFALGLVVIISLASVAFSQKGGKKPSTPEPVWGARIPAYANISGMEGGNHLYTNDDPNVSVRLTKNMTGTTVDNTTITFSIYANSSNDQ